MFLRSISFSEDRWFALPIRQKVKYLFRSALWLEQCSVERLPIYSKLPIPSLRCLNVVRSLNCYRPLSILIVYFRGCLQNPLEKYYIAWQGNSKLGSIYLPTVKILHLSYFKHNTCSKRRFISTVCTGTHFSANFVSYERVHLEQVLSFKTIW